MAAARRPLASVTLPLGVAMALLLTVIVTGMPEMALRLASSAVAVATTDSLPLLDTVVELNTSTKSEATTFAAALVTVNDAVLTRLPDLAVTVMVRLLRSAPIVMAS